MNNEELAKIIHREARFINFLIVMTNVSMFIQLRNMTVKMNETMAGIYGITFMSAAFMLISLLKKPVEVIDLRPVKNVDLR